MSEKNLSEFLEAEKAEKMDELAALCKSFARDHAALSNATQAFVEDLEALKNRHKPTVEKLAAPAAAGRVKIGEFIQANPWIFGSPRSRVLHGVKVGVRHQPGRIDFDDEWQVICKIREVFPEEQADMMVRTIEEVNKNALAEMPDEDLERIGARRVRNSDAPICTPPDKNADKVAQTLMRKAAGK